MAKGLPVDIRKAINLVSGISEERDKQLHLELFVDQTLTPEFREAARLAFLPESESIKLSLNSFSADGDNGYPSFADEVDLTIILTNQSSFCAELFLAASRRNEVVIVAQDATNFVNAWPANLEIDVNRLIALSSEALARGGFELLFGNLAKWMIESQEENRLAWARAFAFVRQVQAKEIISSTSLQNGVIATVFFLPGADLPVLLLNQMRMFFRLASIHDVAFKDQPYAELATLTAQAFVWRALARALVNAMPAVSWAIKGTIGYLGTLALAKAAEFYFEAVHFEQNYAESQNNNLDKPSDISTDDSLIKRRLKEAELV